MANLTQLRAIEGIDGFLLVDKPVGISFSTVVKTVKRKFNLIKVGHGGSLDAMASGLLVLLINDANKFVGDVMGADREYTGELAFGRTTNTGDCHGEAAEAKAVMSPAEAKGDIFLAEPRHAAIRKDGTAGYEIVDTGEHRETLTHIYRFDLDGNSFRLRATKNIIPRALAIGLGATLMSLRRIRVGKFDVADAIPFERLLETELKDFSSCVMSLGTALR